MAGTPQQPIRADLSCQGKTDAASTERLAGGGTLSQEPGTVFKGTTDLCMLRSSGVRGSVLTPAATLTAPCMADGICETKTLEHACLLVAHLEELKDSRCHHQQSSCLGPCNNALRGVERTHSIL